MVTPSAIIFIGLNVHRILSIVSIILVFAAVVTIMVEDGKEAGNDPEDCDYIPGTDVPTHVWGLFWAQLNRLFLLMLLVLCLFSEISWGGICDRFFNYCLPVLGPAFSTAPLSLVQMMIGCTLLSHYLDDFPLVVSWLLFVIGFLNLLLGTIFCSGMKDRRSIFAARRARARDLEIHPRPAAQPSNHTRATAPWKFGTSPKSKPGKSVTIAKVDKWDDAFPSLESRTTRELLRQQAREANARMERAQEFEMAKRREGEVPLDYDEEYDDEHQHHHHHHEDDDDPLARKKRSAHSATATAIAASTSTPAPTPGPVHTPKTAQASKATKASTRRTKSLLRPSMDMFNHKSTNVLGANGAKPGHKLKQRSRTENHLRSFNISSPRPVGITQSSAVPAYPAPPGTAAAGVGAADNGSAQVQEMRETLPCYQPGGGRVHGADHDQHHGQGHESVHLPVARQFASEWTGGRM